MVPLSSYPICWWMTPAPFPRNPYFPNQLGFTSVGEEDERTTTKRTVSETFFRGKGPVRLSNFITERSRRKTDVYRGTVDRRLDNPGLCDTVSYATDPTDLNDKCTGVKSGTVHRYRTEPVYRQLFLHLTPSYSLVVHNRPQICLFLGIWVSS